MEQKDGIEKLEYFLSRAIKLGKYSSATGANISHSLGLLKRLLTDDEPRSADYFREHATEIYMRSGHTEPSILSYRARLERLLEDYAMHGASDKSLFEWKPAARRKRPSVPEKRDRSEGSEEKEPVVTGGVAVHRLELTVRPGVKASIVVPADITKEEAKKLIALLETIAL
jgi:hypothetical protein